MKQFKIPMFSCYFYLNLIFCANQLNNFIHHFYSLKENVLYFKRLRISKGLKSRYIHPHPYIYTCFDTEQLEYIRQNLLNYYDVKVKHLDET